MENNFSQLTNNVIYCRNNGLLDSEKGQIFLGLYDAGIHDDLVTRWFERRVYNHKLGQAFYGRIPFKTPQLTQGDYVLGLGQNGEKLRSYIQYLNAHSLTVAGSGAGKTTASYSKVLQIASESIGLFLFDLQKREMAFLKPYLARKNVNLIILPGRSLRINPLQLPLGVTVSNWLPRVADMLVGVLELPPRASKLLQAKLFALYHKFGHERNLFPTMYDLFEEVKKDGDAHYQAKTAILDSLEPVLLSLGPTVLAYRYGWPSHELAKKQIVFELAGYSEADKNLALNSLILSEFSSRIARGISNPAMDLLICLDEAGRLCCSADGNSAIVNSIGLVRGTGIGLDLSIQGTNGLLPQIVSNTATKIVGRCGSIADYVSAGHSMGLDAEQIQWCQMNLQPGMFVGQLGEGQWRYPFIFRIPPINLTKSTEDQQPDAAQAMNLPTVYAPEFETWGRGGEINSKPPEEAVQESKTLSSDEESLLTQIKSNPNTPSATEHYKTAGLSTKRATAAKQSLIEKNLINEILLESGRRGRAQSFLLLVEANGRLGNPLHCYMRNTADGWYRSQNCTTEFEKSDQIDGRQIFTDLSVAWPNGKTEALEIETEDSPRAVENILKNIKAGYGLVSVLTPNRKTREAIQKRIAHEIDSQIGSRIQLRSIAFYDQEPLDTKGGNLQ